jgi:hypothetical protein
MDPGPTVLAVAMQPPHPNRSLQWHPANPKPGCDETLSGPAVHTLALLGHATHVSTSPLTMTLMLLQFTAGLLDSELHICRGERTQRH